jgi:hypothetical protein
MASDREEQLKRLIELAQRENLLGPAPKSENENESRPLIRIPSDMRELIDFAKECGKELSKESRLFRRDQLTVLVNFEKKRLDSLNAQALRSVAQRHIKFFKFKTVENESGAKSQMTVIKNLSAEMSLGLLHAPDFVQRLPEIDRVNESRLPVMCADGTIRLLDAGYFAERGIFTFDDGLKLDDQMPPETAKEIIDKEWKYFPFPNARSKAAAIAAQLTMFCPNLLPRCTLRPGFIYTANSTGAGKTLAAKMAIIPIVGHAATRTLPRREEQKKVLDIFALQAASYIFFDNIRGEIAGEDIEQFITSAILKGRVLGESTEFMVENVSTVFLTGNQSRTSRDMQERCLFIELFVQEADVTDRTIPIDSIIDDGYLAASETRTRVLSALWSFVRSWAAAGKPGPETVMPRFEAWSNIVAAIVNHAGYGDPVSRAEVLAIGNTELRDMRELVTLLAPRELPEAQYAPAAIAGAGDSRSSTDAPVNLPLKVGEAIWTFSEVIDKVIELGLFADVQVRSGRSREDMIIDGQVTPAGRSHFGKMLTNYDWRFFSVERKMIKFEVRGRGESRRYAVIVLDHSELLEFPNRLSNDDLK